MEFSKLKKLFINILFLPRCMACGELLNIEKNAIENLSLCPECLAKYRIAKAEVCPECNFSAERCLCGVSKRGVDTGDLTKLFYYRTDRESSIQSRIIYALKHENDIRFATFLADELSVIVSRLMIERKINPDECIFTYVPRRSQAVIDDGFDQGERLALCVAKTFDLKRNFARSFVRRGGKEQKKLDANERKRNIRKSVKLRRKIKTKIQNKTVLLFDDLVTSGVTMSEAKSLLTDAGAKAVICITVGRTVGE